jgi:hypothetical protein
MLCQDCEAFRFVRIWRLRGRGEDRHVEAIQRPRKIGFGGGNGCFLGEAPGGHPNPIFLHPPFSTNGPPLFPSLLPLETALPPLESPGFFPSAPCLIPSSSWGGKGEVRGADDRRKVKGKGREEER